MHSNDKNTLNPIEAEILLYKSENGNVRVDVLYTDENIWMTQKTLAELFEVEVPTINYHLKDIFKSNELKEEATIRNFLIVRKEGTRNVSREIAFYNLDALSDVVTMYLDYAENQAKRQKLTSMKQWSEKLDFDKIIQKYIECLDGDKSK